MTTIDALIRELQRQAAGEAPRLYVRFDAAGTVALVGGRIDVAALAEAIDRATCIPELRIPIRAARFSS